jgi:hypothetical protein
MLPSLLEVEGDRGVVGESGKAAFGGDENALIALTDS